MNNGIKNWTLAFATVGVLSMAGAASAGETTGLTDTTIKVGVMGPFTGNASSYSKAQIGLMAYFKHINDQGGINGRKFDIVQEDTACAPAKGIAAAKKLVHQDKVFYLHGNSCSGVAMAVKPTVSPTGIPWIIAHAVNPKITMPVNEKKSIFHGVPAGPAYGSTMGGFVMSRPSTKRIAMVAHTNDWAKAYCDPAIEIIKAAGGKIIEELALERGQTDATAQVLKLKKANPDLRIPTMQLPYFLSLLVAIFHPKINLSWARTHLGRRLFWDASPAERDLGMEWMSPEQSLLETVPPILENEWLV